MARRKFADGGDIEYSGSDEDALATAKARVAAKDAEYEASRSGQSTFKQAFADARKAGDKTFMWNGKKYNTEVASAKPAVRKPVTKSLDPSTDSDYVKAMINKGRGPVTKSLDESSDSAYVKRMLAKGTTKGDNQFKPLNTRDMDVANFGQGFKKGGAVKGWGKARGARKCKVM